MTRSSADIRNEFLEFFRQRGHEIVRGSPVVPYDDPTLLFTNAGMNQFKDVFLATGTRPYTRAANTQPCIRAGGKHNDLDDVGQDTYHHTFFEMLGNWSFGDYFKREAIQWAWELLTGVWGLEKERLHATYFGGDDAAGLEPDLDARDLWAEVTDINPAHIHPGGIKDNFWEMGDVGPCGPCSEIHIDLTPDKRGIKLVNAGDPRVMEIWNLVFIQFNRGPDGKLTPLPAKHVDTGMGLERVTAVVQAMQRGHIEQVSNYDTDLFTGIFQAIRDVTGAPPYRGTLPIVVGVTSAGGPISTGGPTSGRSSDRPEAGPTDDQIMQDVSYRVIADHIRCLTFALNDGAVPDREGRGYVLRRILRRAIRYGWQYLNVHEPFLYKLVPAVVDSLGNAFPQLKGSGHRAAGRDELAGSPAVGPQRVAEIIREEEESFDRTLDRGIALFEQAAERAQHRGGAGILPAISGDDAFKLHDTYGFPIDLTEIMAAERGLRVDIGEYERLMEEARERARTGVREGEETFFEEWRPEAVPVSDDSLKYGPWLGGEATIRMLHVYARDEVAQVPAGTVVPKRGHVSITTHNVARTGAAVAVVTDKTWFYAESGGQVSDTGTVRTQSGEVAVKRLTGPGVHCGYVTSGEIRVRQRCVLQVDAKRRALTMRNHTATHVMNWALREVLGEHVQQKGSLVDPEKTRFDFSHTKPMTPEEVERVEALVNERIAQKLPVHWDDKVPLDVALSINGMRAVFGEKYPDPVRVVASGVAIEDLVQNPGNPQWRRYPIELCGGTHVKNTAEIECFAIVSEEAAAKGIRRVVGITGDTARRAIESGTQLLQRAESLRGAGAARRGAADTGEGARKDSRTSEKGAAPEQNRDRKGADVGGDSRTGPGARRDSRTSEEDTAQEAVAHRADALRSAGPPSPASLEDLAAQVAELQRAADETTMRVVDRHKLRQAIGELQQLLRKQQKKHAAEALDIVNARIDELLRSPEKIGDTTIVVAEMPDVPIDQLKSGADRIKQKCKSAAVLFGVWVGRASSPPSEPEARARDKPPGGKALLLAAMTPDLVEKGIKAGDLVKHLAPLINGGGGGPPTMAQAGGKNPENLGQGLDAGRRWVEQKLR